MSLLSSLHLTALILLLLVAVYTDLKERRIPNKLTVSGLVVGLAFAAAMAGGVPTSGLLGAGLALVLSFPVVALGALGAGDAKLLTAVGSFMGPSGVISVLLYGALAGGVLALAFAFRRGTLWAVLKNSFRLFLHTISLGRYGERLGLDTPGAQTVPYGVAIAAGALAAWFAPLSMGGAL
jgi:prepilin peptidase CpaA